MKHPYSPDDARPARGILPMTVASHCIDAAADQGHVQKFSGKFEHMRRSLERRICAIYGMEVGRVRGQSAFDFEIARDSDGQPRAYFVGPNGAFDHIISQFGEDHALRRANGNS